MKPSISLILSGIFIAFIGHSVWNLIVLFRTPVCKSGNVCYKSFLNTRPDLDLLVFVSDNSRSGRFDELLNIKKFDYTKPLERHVILQLSRAARNNGSLVLHAVLVPSKYNKDNTPLKDLINAPDASYLKGYLTKYAVPVSSTFNLLKDKQLHQNLKPVTHIRSRYVLIMCVEELNLPHNEIPLELVRHIRLNSKKHILPILHKDIMNMRLQELVEITPESKQAEFTLIYSPVSFGKLIFTLQFGAALQQFIQLGFTEKDLDDVKNVFADTNLYLLCATVCIGGVHLLLDFLSFKNDVSFWKTQKSMAGLSTRTVLWRSFSQTVIFLYLLDEGTSLLVLVPSGVATLIEFWKITKVLKPRISWQGGFKFDKYQNETLEEKKTREYDEECMKYLSYVLYPLCIGAAVYSLVYQPHKSWYSWTINSLVNGVYAFGFLFMLPQLFINYRLKSVAALPWRAFTYRAFNTFIDDIFAFIITMPTAHRLACFRDDVVFLIYLYQRWLYPVDDTRIEDISGEVVQENCDNDKKNL